MGGSQDWHPAIGSDRARQAINKVKFIQYSAATSAEVGSDRARQAIYPSQLFIAYIHATSSCGFTKPRTRHTFMRKRGPEH